MKKDSFWSRLKEADQKLADSINVTKMYPGYFNKYVFRVAVWCVFALAFYALYSTGFDFSNHLYVTCPSNSVTPCAYNHYSEGCYEGVPGCSPEYTITLVPGDSFGTPPPDIVKNFSSYALLIILAGFVANHIIYKRKNKREVRA